MWFYFFLAFVVFIPLWIRFSPNPPDKWHIDPSLEQIKTGRSYQKAFTNVFLEAGDVFSVVPALNDEKAKMIAGSVQQGFVTFLVRTQGMGYPDFLSAKLENDVLYVYSRSRFGNASDWGRNKRRVVAWKNKLDALAASK